MKPKRFLIVLLIYCMLFIPLFFALQAQFKDAFWVLLLIGVVITALYWGYFIYSWKRGDKK